ncbi:MAG: hypothetical protein C4346_04170, partial [Chloroflexota bacterium]
RSPVERRVHAEPPAPPHSEHTTVIPSAARDDNTRAPSNGVDCVRTWPGTALLGMSVSASPLPASAPTSTVIPSDARDDNWWVSRDGANRLAAGPKLAAHSRE